MSVLKSHTISFERYTIMPVEPALPGKSQVRPKYSVPMYYMLHRTTCTPYCTLFIRWDLRLLAWSRYHSLANGHHSSFSPSPSLLVS